MQPFYVILIIAHVKKLVKRISEIQQISYTPWLFFGYFDEKQKS